MYSCKTSFHVDVEAVFFIWHMLSGIHTVLMFSVMRSVLSAETRFNTSRARISLENIRYSAQFAFSLFKEKTC